MSCLSFSYKKVDDISLVLDVYGPNVVAKEKAKVPALVYFHGGGLTVGNRNSWFPGWLESRLTSTGMAFISAEYRLIPPATGHDILSDIKDAFTFVRRDLDALLDAESAGFHIDPDALAVSGTSAGGLCAYLAAMHVHPKPKALLCMYPMLGDCLTPHYVNPKTQSFFLGREMLDPESFRDYLYPFPTPLPSACDSPLQYDPPTAPIPGYPANKRMLLSRLYLQLGVFLDYYCGEHDPSLSARLREFVQAASGEEDKELCLRNFVPTRHHALLPQLGLSVDWPPTFLVHGSKDTAVPVDESRHMHALMQRAGAQVRLEVVEGREHSFDYAPDAEDLHSNLFDAAVTFLRDCLSN